MEFVENEVIEILKKLPNENPWLDYKQIPYKKDQMHSFLKDVIAMLNSEAAAGRDKFIIFGVTDGQKKLIGIKLEDMRDDNEWQNILKKISPKPDVRTGSVEYLEKSYGYIYIPASNNEWVYEANESVYSPKSSLKEKNIISKGQAYTRSGSKNEVLTEEGRIRLREKKVQNLEISHSSIFEHSKYNNILLAMALVGGWNEESVGDIEVIEKLSGTGVDDVLGVLRVINDQNPGILTYSDRTWKLCNHGSFLVKESKHVYDAHIESFFKILQTCSFEVDPRYDLPSNKRSFAEFYNYNCQKKYSKSIVYGLAETLAIFGNHHSDFNNCYHRKIIDSIYAFEREYFKASDWKIYATGSDILQLLGEACPDVFMTEICRLLQNKDDAFLQFLTEDKDDLITPLKYGSEIGIVLSNIAMIESYFSKAMSTLFLLSQIRPQFIETMAGIVLPWRPQTHASLKSRVRVFEGLAKEDNKLTWDILMKLMPDVTTMTNPISKPKYLEIKDIPGKITRREYYETTVAYVRLAEEMMGSDVDRMCTMISVINHVDADLQQEVLQTIKDNAGSLDDHAKTVLWNCIIDCVNENRNYSDAEWALGKDRLADVEELAKWLIPDDTLLRSVRLFRYNQSLILMDIRKNNDIELDKLKDTQINVLKNIYESTGVKGLYNFIKQIENKKIAGVMASIFLSYEDIQFFARESGDIVHDEFLEGAISSRPFEEIEHIIEELSDAHKSEIVGKLPLTDNLIRYVKSLDTNAQKMYWENTAVPGYMDYDLELFLETISNLNKYNRTEKSIESLYYYVIHGKKDVRPELIIQTLKMNVAIRNKNALYEYYIQELIKWLQERSIERASILKIEWKYLSFLRESEGYPPIYLWEELSDNPDFFVSVIKRIFGKEDDVELNNTDKQIVWEQCYKLISEWKRVPGLNKAGKIDKDKLAKWFEYVKAASQGSDIENLAMNYFGKAAFHAPADEDGFFIDREVAKYLQTDVNGSILCGYQMEAINSRGAYFVDPTGETEFKIEKEYRVKAKEADENGMFRVAETLNKIADTYHEEGLRNKETCFEDEY